MFSVRRFQVDTQWQTDFRRLLEVEQDCIEHSLAGHQLLREGAVDAAGAELELAEEDHELMELLKMKLRDLT